MSETTATALVQEADTTPRFIEAAALSEIPPGWVLKVRLGNREVALANREGEIHALDAFCTHAGGPIGDSRLKSGCFVECSWHNAAFDVRDGAVRAGPARKPLRAYPVKVEDGTIFVALDGGS